MTDPLKRWEFVPEWSELLHAMLDDAGVAREPSAILRVRLLIDERNSLKDELEQMRSRRKVTNFDRLQGIEPS